MRSLLIYLKDYKKETILAPLFKMLEASFELFVPLVMAAVIDVGIAGRDKPYIVKMCLVLIALGIIGLVCSITAQYFSAKAAAGFGTGVRHALFKHIQSFTFTEMDTVGSSTLITRMTSDINQAQSGVNMVLRLFLRSPFIVFGAMVMAFTVDVKAAKIFVVVIPLLSVIVFGIMLITMPLYRKVQSNLDSVLLTTRENLAGARVIRAFNKEPDERKRFERENQALTDAQKFVGRISGLMNPLTYIIVNGGIIALIGVIVLPVTSGDTALRALRLTLSETLHIDQSTNAKRMGLAAPVFVLVAGIIVWAKMDTDGFNILWRYFAWSNQTLSLFAFLAITVWMFENGKAKYCWVPLLPGAFYAFICSSFISNATIGFNLPWAVAYPIGAVLTVAYVVAIVTYGKKRAARAALNH